MRGFACSYYSVSAPALAPRNSLQTQTIKCPIDGSQRAVDQQSTEYRLSVRQRRGPLAKINALVLCNWRGAVSMEVAVTCSNSGFCGLADDAVPLDTGLVACPRCSKLLASPHRLSITPMPGLADLPRADRVSVKIERLSRPASVTALKLRLDGRHAGTHREPASLIEGAVGKFPADLEGGHLVTAVLETNDGHRTIRSLPWFGRRRDGLLMVIMLLVVALVCLWLNLDKGAVLPGDWAGDDSQAGLLLLTAAVGMLACAWLYRKAARPGSAGIPMMILAAGIAATFVVRQAGLLGDSATGELTRRAVIVFLVFVALAVVVMIVRLMAARQRGHDGRPPSGKQDAAN